jgi:WD40 repeat protein
MWAASAGHPGFDPGELVPWRALWARWSIGSGETLGRHTGPLTAVATAVLPDGRPIAITASHDATVRTWDLTTATPLGDPLTGHTDWVTAVATAVLPDGRPIAVTGSRDATVRIWDLQRMTAMQEPLHLVSAVTALATLHLPTGVHLAVAGAGITAVALRHQAL